VLHIIEASPAEYREISSADMLGGAKRPRRFAVPPVLGGGKIYCRNYAGDLVCIDVSKQGPVAEVEQDGQRSYNNLPRKLTHGVG
jgi:hypothetical protein